MRMIFSLTCAAFLVTGSCFADLQQNGSVAPAPGSEIFLASLHCQRAETDPDWVFSNILPAWSYLQR